MEIKTDFLVLGTGIAGLGFAIKASKLGTVAVVTKKDSSESNTNYAQGGIAAVQDLCDSFEYHINDTLVCGAGLSNPDVVRFVVEEGPDRIKDLIEWGVEFTRSEGGTSPYDLGQEGGHSMRRVLHAKDLTGHEIERALNEKVASMGTVSIYENHIAIDLIMSAGLSGSQSEEPDTCLGAYVLDIEGGEVHTFLAKYTIIATGGAGKVYLITSNPDIATGDGIAMAYRAGAKIANMEFIQFHPTCLYHPDAKSFLLSETMRGEGGILRMKNGAAFMEKYHPLGSLAPRDSVAKAIDNEIKISGDDYVLLDMTHLERAFLQGRFPNIYDQCLKYGLDMAKDPLPVVPAAHYICGGILVNSHGETSIEGLYACGESSCTGLHGANRLASNSLLEAIVFAHRSFQRIAETFASSDFQFPPIPPWSTTGVMESDDSIVVSQNWDELRRTMWNYVGIVRSNRRLERALSRIELISREIDEYYKNFFLTKDLIELRNIALVARMITCSAMSRLESRGLHYNLDYPGHDDANFLKDTIISKHDALVLNR
ncbi:MAG: L-aspartate oxidase [Smithellaceae bacterium]|nr:L-aspartate oxidase [Smithellaceae bacterium]